MSEPAGSASLAIEQRDQPATRLVLGATTVRIGRGTGSDLHVPDPHISKQHAEVRRELGQYVVVDVGSRAGVLVNGARVDRRALADGDVIELGDSSPVRITFRQQATPPLDTTSFAAVAGSPGDGGMARLARFFEFSAKLGGGFSLAEVLQDVVDLAIEVTRAERGLLILRRDDGSFDTQVARATGGRTLPLDGLRVSETLLKKAFAGGKPTVVEDVAHDADLAIAASIVSLELRSAVTLPLVRYETRGDGETAAMRVFGVLYLDSRRQRGGFDGVDLGILARLASDASAVIENARLVREAEEQRRIAREVAMAREVQAALMPEQFRSTPAFEVAGTCVPCHELGGDYVDQFDLGGGRQALVVADVAGKGIAASLLAATLQGAFAAEIARGEGLADAVARVNRVHCRLAPVGKFITMAVVLLEPTGEVTVVDAGHCPVLHVHAGGAVAVGARGMALGLDADARYVATTLQPRPGDHVVVFTDGVVECEGPGRELFGDERLTALLAARHGHAAKAVLADVLRDVDVFRRGESVSDDLSVLVVRRR
jgi:sigma-B regulation protein RsbU (phosphoserine phosphatase)